MQTDVIQKSKTSWIKNPLVPLIIVMIIALVAHSFNMLNFPIFDEDEGTYVRGAWSLIRLGLLESYVYNYGHAPIGWMQIAAWFGLTGGFWTFGSPLDSARILVMLYHLGSTYLLYKIAHKISGRTDVAFLACFIFAASPIAIAFQRRINLDNPMVLWMLISFYFLVYSKHRMTRIVFSAVAFGFAILTKETAIFFIPAYLVLLYLSVHPLQRRMGIPMWITTSVSIVSFYVLYAALQNELFPSGTLLGGTGKHVSLLNTYMGQASRSGGGGIGTAESLFWQTMNQSWLYLDWLLLATASAATIVLIVVGFKKHIYWVVALANIGFFCYVARGGVVFDFYIIPAIPFMALAVALVFGLIMEGSEWLLPRLRGKNPVIGFAVLGLFIFYLSSPWYTETFLTNETLGERMAIQWVADNLPQDAKIIVDDYATVELREGRPEWGGKKYPNTHYYWPIGRDADNRERANMPTWRDMDYMIITPIMELDLHRNDLGPVSEAYNNSDLVAVFNNIEIRRVRNGDNPRVIGESAWAK